MQRAPDLFVGYANTFHDPAIAICDGEQLFAEGLERPAQIKRGLWLGGIHYARRSLRNACRTLGLDAPKIVSFRTSWAPGFFRRCLDFLLLFFYARLEPLMTNQPLVALIGFSQASFRGQVPITTYQLRREIFSTRPEIVHRSTSHHFAHAATAVYTSPFSECAVMVLDGSGENDSSSFFHFSAGRFRLLAKSSNRHSLGFLYAAITLACGFSTQEGEEWKVMGLAAYGERRPELYDFFRQRIDVNGLRVRLRFARDEFRQLEKMVGGFRALEGPDALRMADLAHNFQACFADVVCELAGNLHGMGLSQNLAYAGGCALNSSANGRIVPRSGFSALHVPPAPADDGNCLGLVLHDRYSRAQRQSFAAISPYLGSDIDHARLEQILGFGGILFTRLESDEALCEHTAALLSDGKIVGWMQGRAEFGPRALGHRSILADPRRADMKDRINALVKFREEFRPLAPSILYEHVGEFFAAPQPSPYMERTLEFLPEAKTRVPAVVHKDGTGRLQTVTREMSPLYWQLIEAFRAKTGVPLLLNTSLNVMGKPIVHGVEDAITLFFTTGLDHLVIGRNVLTKSTAWSA